MGLSLCHVECSHFRSTASICHVQSDISTFLVTSWARRGLYLLKTPLHEAQLSSSIEARLAGMSISSRARHGLGAPALTSHFLPLVSRPFQHTKSTFKFPLSVKVHAHSPSLTLSFPVSTRNFSTTPAIMTSSENYDISSIFDVSKRGKPCIPVPIRNESPRPRSSHIESPSISPSATLYMTVHIPS